MLFGHGDDAYLQGKNIEHNFSSNVVRSGISQQMVDFLKNNIGCVENYPEVVAESLVERIAKFHNVESDNVLVTSGATAAFYLIAQLFRDHTSTIFTPSFAEYEDACRTNNHSLLFRERSKIKDYSCSFSDLVWICNPNNPDGELLKSGLLASLAVNYSETIFVIDEAYIEFTSSAESESMIQYLSTLSNVIIVRSLTKNLAIPGLRLGYIVALEHTISQLKNILQPWSVNALAIAAGNYYFDNKSNFNINIDSLLNDTKLFSKQLMQTGICNISQSSSSFFLAELVKGDSESLKKYLIDEHGILIRNASNFRGLNEKCFRLATQSVEQNQKLVNAVKQWSCLI